MIRSFADKETRRLAAGIRSRVLPTEIQDKAVRLLRLMEECDNWTNCAAHPATSSMPCMVTEKGNMLCGSIGSGGSPSLRLREL
jgi:hypothetical protein